LRTNNARYEAISDRAVRVSGSEFVHDPEYTIKLPRARAGEPDGAVPYRIPGALIIATLGDLAKLVRSKNAGPFWLIDIIFDDAEAYRRARDAETRHPRRHRAPLQP
jgi:hypothetical protein